MAITVRLTMICPFNVLGCMIVCFANTVNVLSNATCTLWMLHLLLQFVMVSTQQLAESYKLVARLSIYLLSVYLSFL